MKDQKNRQKLVAPRAGNLLDPYAFSSFHSPIQLLAAQLTDCSASCYYAASATRSAPKKTRKRIDFREIFVIFGRCHGWNGENKVLKVSMGSFGLISSCQQAALVCPEVGCESPKSDLEVLVPAPYRISFNKLHICRHHEKFPRHQHLKERLAVIAAHDLRLDVWPVPGGSGMKRHENRLLQNHLGAKRDDQSNLEPATKKNKQHSHASLEVTNWQLKQKSNKHQHAKSYTNIQTKPYIILKSVGTHIPSLLSKKSPDDHRLPFFPHTKTQKRPTVRPPHRPGRAKWRSGTSPWVLRPGSEGGERLQQKPKDMESGCILFHLLY